MIKPDKFTTARSAVAEKVKESAVSVLPIVLIVTLLCLGIAPTKPELLLCFFIGALMIVLGMGLFSLGAEQSMTPIGNKIGTALTKTKNLPLMLGFAITIAEPDLQVLAETVPHIKNIVLLVTVGVGVGFFHKLEVAVLDIIFFKAVFICLLHASACYQHTRNGAYHHSNKKEDHYVLSCF